MSTVRFNPVAEMELVEAATFLEGERKNLGNEFLEEIARALDFAARFPKAALRARGSIRSLVVSRFSDPA